MPFVPVPDTARVTLNFIGIDGGDAHNVIYVGQTDTPISAGTLANIALSISGWANDSWAPIASNQWTLASIDALDVSVENGAYVNQSVQVQGEVINDALPAMNTLSVRLQTGFSGRSRRGRLYHVGLAEEQVMANYVTALAADAIVDAYLDLRTALQTDEFQWRVASFQQDGVVLSVANTYGISGISLHDRKVKRQVRRMFHSS